MAKTALKNLTVGEEIELLTTAPITRRTLALYAGASGDHHPLHIDSDFAKAAGMGDVFAHGMLSMAYLGKGLTDWIPQSALRAFSVRFVAITHVHDQLTCRGTVKEIFERSGETRVRLELSAQNQEGDTKLTGEAVIAVSEA